MNDYEAIKHLEELFGCYDACPVDCNNCACGVAIAAIRNKSSHEAERQRVNLNRIDDLKDVDLASLTFAEIVKICGTVTPVGEGYRRGVSTRLGDIEEQLWYQLVEVLIDRHNECWLMEALEKWYRDNPPMLSDEHQSVRQYVLEQHCSRSFDDEGWQYFIPFNRKYRPELVEERVFPVVRMCCCGAMEEVTEKVFDAGVALCPACGDFHTFEAVSADKV